MKILITGGAGYVGILLTEALLQKNYQVTVLDNFMYGHDFILHLLRYQNLKIVKYDIRNDIKPLLTECDVIFHLAGISGYPACEANPSSAHYINVEATRSLAKVVSPSQLLVYAATTASYGDADGGVCTEETKPKPASLYGITKSKAEQFVMEHENSISLRFATLFGVSPKMRSDLLVNDFACKAVHDRCIVLFEAGARRTFLHVRDAVRAYLLAMEQSQKMKNNIYNVGYEVLNYTKLEIAGAIKEKTGCTVIDSPIQDVDQRNFTISFDKIRALGYEPKVTLDQGIDELVSLYRFYRPYSAFRTI